MLFREYLSEVSKDAEKKFGKFIFGDFLKMDEPDTKYEKDVFKKIKDFVGGHYRDVSKQKIIKTLKELLKYKKDYDVLKPNGTTLYRAIAYSSVKKEMGDIGNKKFTLKPKDEIQSWTTNQNRAEELSNILFDGEKYETYIIMKAKFKKDELLFNSDFLNKVASLQFGLSSYAEDEIIHIGKAPIKVNIVFTKIVK